MNAFLWAVFLVICACPGGALTAQDIFSGDVLVIRIRFEEQDWRERLMMSRKYGDNARLDAHVTINDVAYPGVQVRFKGNSSYNAAVKAGHKKLPLNLKASDATPFAGGYETLKLANNFRDPSAVREMLSYRIAGTYVPAPKCAHAAVYVNDEYLGVYTATEGINSTMVSRFFCYRKRGIIQAEPDFKAPDPPGCPKGSYSSLEYLGEDRRCYETFYELKDPGDWPRLIRLTRVLKDSTFLIEDVLDVHLALWMHAINNTLVNLDSYLGFFCHNYYLFLDSAGIFHPLLWDFNLAFGGFHILKSGVEVDFETLSPIAHERYRLDNRPLITELLKNDRYRRLYFTMIRTILDDWFVNGRYLEIALKWQDQIRPFIQMEQGGFFNENDFDRSLDETVKKEGRSILGLAQLMTRRTEYLDTHPLLQCQVLRMQEYFVSGKGDRTVIRIRTSPDVEAVRIWIQGSECRSFDPVRMTGPDSENEFMCEVQGTPYAFYLELENASNANLWPLQAPGSVVRLEKINE